MARCLLQAINVYLQRLSEGILLHTRTNCNAGEQQSGAVVGLELGSVDLR